MSVELAIRLMSDFIPQNLRFDSVHLMGQTENNQESVIARGVELVKSGKCARLTIMDEAISGYPGSQAWEKEIKKRLGESSVTIKHLSFPIINGEKQCNSYGEAISSIAQAKKMGWRWIAIIAQPLHQLRSFLGFIKALGVMDFQELKVYSIPGLPLSWSENVIHSQGVLKGTRSDLLKSELVKVEKYLLDFYDAALHYLDLRDGISH